MKPVPEAMIVHRFDYSMCDSGVSSVACDENLRNRSSILIFVLEIAINCLLSLLVEHCFSSSNEKEMKNDPEGNEKKQHNTKR